MGDMEWDTEMTETERRIAYEGGCDYATITKIADMVVEIIANHAERAPKCPYQCLYNAFLMLSQEGTAEGRDSVYNVKKTREAPGRGDLDWMRWRSKLQRPLASLSSTRLQWQTLPSQLHCRPKRPSNPSHSQHSLILSVALLSIQ